jgi:DNA repair exonuclease SbcCD ATPase subunit
MKSSYDPLGARPNDPIAKWCAEAEQFQRECEQARRELKDEERRDAEAARANRSWSELEQRIAALEAARVELQDGLLEGMRACSEAFDVIFEQRIGLADKQLDEIHDLKVEVAKLGSVVTELREQRAKEFQFARERKGEVEDLPNPLQSRRDLN